MLHDVLHGEVRTIVGLLEGVDARTPYSPEELLRRVDLIEAASADLVRSVAVAAYYIGAGDRLLPGVIAHLANAFERKGGQDVWLDLQRYASLLALYSAGLGLVSGDREDRLGPLLLARKITDRNTSWPIASRLYPQAVLEQRVAQQLPEMERHFTPVSDRLHEYLAPLIGSVVPDFTAYDRVFDRFEVILGLVTFDLSRTAEGRGWGPIGRFGWRRDHGGQAIEELEAEMATPERSPLTKGGLFNGDPARFVESAKVYIEFLSRARYF
jgi:hypothetical protein